MPVTRETIDRLRERIEAKQARLDDLGEHVSSLPSFNGLRQDIEDDRAILELVEKLPRPSVMAFAVMMETTLRKHDGTKGGQASWRDESPEWLLDRMYDEVVELAAAIDQASGYGSDEPDIHARRERVQSEATDVANFAMMIADRVGKIADDPILAARSTAGQRDEKGGE